MKLNELSAGESGVVTHVGGEGALRQHFLDMGLIPGVPVTVEKFAPMGDPIELHLHGYQLSLRKADAAQIEIDTDVQAAEAAEEEADRSINLDIEHPGLGEEGPRFHTGASKARTQHITFALAGNQNSGKTTLFNQLTGSNQHVGNFPGVTVDRKDGHIKGHPETTVTDLPGIYSLSPYTSEEIVSRRFILESHPQGIINIVDATNIERNLYLTMQLMELSWAYPSFPSAPPRIRVWTNWCATPSTWHTIRNCLPDRTSAASKTTEAPFTAASTAPCTSSKIMHNVPASHYVLQPAS